MKRLSCSWNIGCLSFIPLVGALAEIGAFPSARWFGIALASAFFIALLPSLIEICADLREEAQERHKERKNVQF
jgi:hypothetical protein